MQKLFNEFEALANSMEFAGDSQSANLIKFLVERKDVAIKQEREDIIEAFNQASAVDENNKGWKNAKEYYENITK